MLSSQDLTEMAWARLKDAKVLRFWRRYDGAVYLSGYAVEMSLKARICHALKWTGFPETPTEFQGRTTFKTHNLELLLQHSGMESKIKPKHFAEWSTVLKWDPNVRYRPIGSASAQEARQMIASVAVLLKAL